MDERKSPTSWFERDGPWLVVLLVCTGLLRLWLFVNTEVTARDSIGFIRYTRQFDEMPWTDVLKGQHQHPGYPAAVWLMSRPMIAVWGMTPLVMQRAAQLVSLIAALLLAVVMFQLGKRLWDRFVGFWAALLFQFLPGSGHHLSDGISDGLFLLFVASAILCLVRAMQSNRTRDFAIGGAFIGLAYLTRPEGLLLAPAFAVVWTAFQFNATTRRSWLPWLTNVAAAGAACILVGSVYVFATHKLTIKPTSTFILGTGHAAAPGLPSAILFASLWGSTFTPNENNWFQFGQTLRALVNEVGQAFHYAGAFFGLWTIVFCRGQLIRRIEVWLGVVYFVIHTVILVLLGMTASYVSERHVLPLVMLGSYPCVIGLKDLLTRIASRGWFAPAAVPRVCAIVLILFVAACLPKTGQRLHGNRVPNHDAGRWLAERVRVGDVIVDEHKWSHYYSGLFFSEATDPVLPRDFDPKCYTVVVRATDHVARDGREKLEESLQKANVRAAYHWPTNAPLDKARLVVYESPRNMQTHPWKREPASVIARPVSREK
jgi:hypothetical protein